jgi:hypothetical protein
VITLQAALLCNAASQEASGLISMLGAFLDRLQGPQLPIRAQLWLVARLLLEQDDTRSPHAFVIIVEHTDGTEQLARVEATSPAAPDVQAPLGVPDPDLPIGAPLVVPLPLEFRRRGLYVVRLLVDGEQLWEGRLSVQAQLPQL